MTAKSEETPRPVDQGIVIPDPQPRNGEAEIAADDAGASAMAERAGKSDRDETP